MHDDRRARALSRPKLSVDFTHTPKLTRSQASLRRACMRLRRVERVPPQRTRKRRTSVRLTCRRRVVRRRAPLGADDGESRGAS